MTEAEWVDCTDPVPMLEFLRGKASDRKFRLFAVACCRRIWPLIADRGCRQAVDVAEKHADGLVTDKKLEKSDAAVAAKVAAERLAAWSTLGGYVRYMAAGAAHCTVKWRYLSDSAANSAQYASRASKAVEEEGESQAQASLLRDIIGNPFQPEAIDGGCRTDEARRLAQAIYEARAFDRMRELAGALERAGCDHTALLAHCREPGPHVRGCWALDMILGRS